MDKLAHNAKIMVNWETKNILHTYYRSNTKEFKDLIKKGYVKVGMIRPEDSQTKPKIFWEAEFFKPYARYEKHT